MRISNTLAVATLAVLLTGTAFAQETSGQAGDESATETYPEVCRQVDDGAGNEMAPHAGMGMPNMQEHQRAAMEGMMRMDRDMMQGMMADDPDVAFICGMIAHHQGAIDMAQVEEALHAHDGLRRNLQDVSAFHAHRLGTPQAHVRRMRGNLRPMRRRLRAARRYAGMRGGLPPLCRILPQDGGLTR